jgi:LmbE family N-acetylglucosaminyl deacetylase
MRVLAIGAHPDDIELGCGGTLALHAAAGHAVTLLVMTAGERGPQAQRERRREQMDAAAILGADLLWGDFPDGRITAGPDTISAIERALAAVAPDVVYTHSPNDSHQDHRAVAEATLSAARRVSNVCFYEGPTTTSFAPTMYVDVAGGLDTKMAALRAHLSQVLKNGLVDLEAVEALARVRGFQARIRQAEAFESVRYVVRIGASSPTPHVHAAHDLELHP